MVWRGIAARVAMVASLTINNEENSAVKDRPQAARLACLALIALGYGVAAITTIICLKNGQKLTIDDDGFYLQGGYLCAIAMGPAILSSIAGNLAAKGWRGMARGIFLCALAVLLVSGWQSFGYLSGQTLGKVKLGEMRAKSERDKVELENATILQERKELRDVALRTYVVAKSREGKEQALSDVERLTGKPI